MRITIIFFLLCFTTLDVQSQDVNLDMCDIIRHSLHMKSTDSVTQLLEMHSDELTPKQKAHLYSIRGRLWVALNKKNIKRSSYPVDPLLIKANDDLTLAIQQLPDEKDRLRFIARRYFVLENYSPYYNQYQSDLKILSEHGLKKRKEGMSIVALSKFDGDFWLGVEGSLFSSYSPSYTVRDEYGKIVMKDKVSTSMSFLIMSYARNLQASQNDFGASFLRVEAPLFIDIFRVGFIETEGSTEHWYYRPELGIGYSIFHLSAGYNIFFRPGNAKELNKLQFNFRVKHTL